jgi:hypothetical protein
VTLRFHPELHKYTLDDVELPSVSQILDMAGMTPSYPITGEYRARGTAVHSACTIIDRGRGLRVDPRLEGYVESYRKFQAEFRIEWDIMEEPAYHGTLLYAGTADRVSRKPRRIADIKTGAPPRKRLQLQLAAYALLYGMPDAERMGVELDPDGGKPKIHTCSDPQDIDVWIGLVHRFHWERKK